MVYITSHFVSSCGTVEQPQSVFVLFCFCFALFCCGRDAYLGANAYAKCHRDASNGRILHHEGCKEGEIPPNYSAALYVSVAVMLSCQVWRCWRCCFLYWSEKLSLRALFFPASFFFGAFWHRLVCLPLGSGLWLLMYTVCNLHACGVALLAVHPNERLQTNNG